MVILVLSIVVLVLITMLVLLFKFCLHVYKSNSALIETCRDLGKHYNTFVKLYDKYRAAESETNKVKVVKEILDVAQDINNMYYYDTVYDDMHMNDDMNDDI